MTVMTPVPAGAEPAGDEAGEYFAQEFPMGSTTEMTLVVDQEARELTGTVSEQLSVPARVRARCPKWVGRYVSPASAPTPLVRTGSIIAVAGCF